jgi:hypothetical protein
VLNVTLTCGFDRRANVVANLIADVESKMNHGAQAQGARDLAAAF